MLLPILYFSCLLISAVAATWFQRSLKSRQLTLFIPLLWLVVIQEYGILIGVQYKLLETTGIFYNIYRPITTAFLAVIFYRIPINAPMRKLISWMYAAYFLVTVMTFAFIQPINKYNSYLSLASGFVITSWAIFFLFNYFNLDDPTEEQKWLPVIPITVGIISFYPVVNISFAFYKSLLSSDAVVWGTKLYQSIPKVMSILMYSCFTYAFYLCRKKN